MNFKILDMEHRIVAADMPGRKKGGVCVCYSHTADVIAVNRDSQNTEKIAEMIALYMNLEDRDRLEIRDSANDETIQGVLRAVDCVIRIRRHLHKRER